MNSPNKEATPIPQGNYLTATRFGNIIHTSGMTPRKNGELIQKGKVYSTEPVSAYKIAVRQAVSNAIIATKNQLAERERIEQVLSLIVYINAEETFESHSALADYASDYLYEELGTSGIGSRVAVGVSSLPGNAPVEIQLVSAAGKHE